MRGQVISSRRNTRKMSYDSRNKTIMAKKSTIPGTPEPPDFTNEPEQPPAPLPPLKASLIPQVDKTPIATNGSDPCPYITDDRFTDGIWNRVSDGEDYALCIHDADGYGNTHTARNSEHQWQGRAADFNTAFNRK